MKGRRTPHVRAERHLPFRWPALYLTSLSHSTQYDDVVLTECSYEYEEESPEEDDPDLVEGWSEGDLVELTTGQ